MVALLFRKTLRDLARSAATYLICTLIVAGGFCGYCLLSVTSDRIEDCKRRFMRDTSFCDVFVELESVPLTMLSRVQALEGVLAAEGRLTATVQTAGLAKPGGLPPQLALVSIREGGLNLPLLSQGSMPRSGELELCIGENFLEAHALAPGGELALYFGGERVPLRLTGAGISPENIYMVKNVSDFVPDPSRYDAGFVSYDTLARLLHKQGSANSLLLRLAPGASFPAVKAALEELLEPYGLRSVYERGDQPSVSMLDGEIRQLDAMSTILPFLFLFVAAVILSISLRRLIEQQRIQIGALMALGFSRRLITLHYCAYGALIGFVGGFFGGLLGNFGSTPTIEYYQTYFSLPNVSARLSPRYLILGALISTLFCALISWRCVRQVARLRPAEALRPAAPKAARTSPFERIPGLRSLLTVPGLMGLRALARNRRRTLLSVLAISCAYMITATLVSVNTLMDSFIFNLLERSQRQSVTVSFTRPLDPFEALSAVQDEGVERAELVTDIPVTLRSPSKQINAGLRSVDTDATLTRLYDEGGSRVAVPGDGVVLSLHMAKLLGLRVGDWVEVETLLPEKEKHLLCVTGLAAEYLSGGGYVSRELGARLTPYGAGATAVLLKTTDAARERILERLEGASAVAGVESRQERLDILRQMMGSMSGLLASFALIGVLIGFAVVYTGSLIGFEELKRELATMLMLGVPRRQCLDVLTTGQWMQALGGIFCGIPLTLLVSRWISAAFTTDLYAMPEFVDAHSLFWGAVLTLAAVAFSGGRMLRKLATITPVEILRERE